jgi:hypothetical protein
MFALQLSIGLWSGNKRKIEIAESHSQPLITVSILTYKRVLALTDIPKMIRRAGKFRRRVPPPAPELHDDDNTIEEKWRAWIESESSKRLAFHILLHVGDYEFL